ncbi:hypothetical protein [Mycolicibacterium lacusdiani]|uniref:hypothetical protein n=1 Tax=Mycolicibacterium lacusdiani TaxID=2895283 RepID=UPI001F23C0A2|nr:hypothetical protein [Mycolicibacterium lacusdiani]
MTTVATRFSGFTTNFKVGTAAVAVVAAATLTPTLAQATPTLTPFMEGIGGSVSSLVDPVVYPMAAAAAASSCATADFALGCYAVEGAVAGTQQIVRGFVVYAGTTAYVLVAATGELLKFIGNILPGALGDFFTNVGNGVSAFANTIAQNLQVGPYQTAQ